MLGEFGQSAAALTRNPLGLIALFLVLVYGMASLVVGTGSSLDTDERLPLIWFLVVSPIVVLGVFAWLVSQHHEKLYAPSDYRDEANFFKSKLKAAASLGAATVTVGQSQRTDQDFTEIADVLFDATPPPRSRTGAKSSTILWVDDRPENNVHVRRAFQLLGFQISIALTTNDALDLLDHNQYGAVISDMGRKEGTNEGYALLQAVRDRGLSVPFFVYASSNRPEHRRMALDRGADGSTNDPGELVAQIKRALRP